MFLLQVPFACKEHESVGIDEKTCLFGNEEYHFRFESFLHKVRFRSVDPNHQNYADQGYTQSKTHQIDEHRSVMHTYWTQKGRIFLYDILKNEGILPLIEIED